MPDTTITTPHPVVWPGRAMPTKIRDRYRPNCRFLGYVVDVECFGFRGTFSEYWEEALREAERRAAMLSHKVAGRAA